MRPKGHRPVVNVKNSSSSDFRHPKLLIRVKIAVDTALELCISTFFYFALQNSIAGSIRALFAGALIPHSQ